MTCTYCGNDVCRVPISRSDRLLVCNRCLEAKKRLRANRKSNGRCIRCGNNRSLHGSTCDQCRTNRLNNREQRKKAGLCRCGIQLSGMHMCRQCMADRNCRTRSIRSNRQSQGLCRCGNRTPEPGKKQCKECNDGSNKRNNALRLKAIDKYGGSICKCCGDTDIDSLSFHHVNNDGNIDRNTNKYRQGAQWYRQLIHDPVRSDICILCMNCQMSIANHPSKTCAHIRKGLIK